MSAQREHAIVTEGLSLWYGDFQALDGVSTRIRDGDTGLIGPSGCGKTTFSAAQSRERALRKRSHRGYDRHPWQKYLRR